MTVPSEAWRLLARAIRHASSGSMLALRTHALETAPAALLALDAAALDDLLRLVVAEAALMCEAAAAGSALTPRLADAVLRPLAAGASSDQQRRELAIGLAEAGMAIMADELVRPPGVLPTAAVPHALAECFVRLALEVHELRLPGGRTPGGVLPFVLHADQVREWLARLRDAPELFPKLVTAWAERLAPGDGAFEELALSFAGALMSHIFAVATGTREHDRRMTEFSRRVPLAEELGRYTEMIAPMRHSPSLAYVAACAGVSEAATTLVVFPSPLMDEQDLGRALTSWARRALFDLAEVKELLG